MLQFYFVGVLAVDFLDSYHRHSCANETDIFGGGVGEVDDSLVGERTSVVHFHYRAFVVSEVSHFEQGAKGVCAVCAGISVLVIGTSTAGSPSVKLVGIIGRQSFCLCLHWHVAER